MVFEVFDSVMGFGHLVEAVRERGSFWMCGIGSRVVSVTNLPVKILCKTAYLGDGREGCDWQSSRGSVI